MALCGRAVRCLTLRLPARGTRRAWVARYSTAELPPGLGPDGKDIHYPYEPPTVDEVNAFKKNYAKELRELKELGASVGGMEDEVLANFAKPGGKAERLSHVCGVMFEDELTEEHIGRFYIESNAMENGFLERFVKDEDTIQDYRMVRQPTLDVRRVMDDFEAGKPVPPVVHAIGKFGTGKTMLWEQAGEYGLFKRWLVVMLSEEVTKAWAQGGPYIQREEDLYQQPDLSKTFVGLCAQQSSMSELHFGGEFEFGKGDVRSGASMLEIMEAATANVRLIQPALAALRVALTEHDKSKVLVAIDGYDRFYGDTEFADTTTRKKKFVPSRQMEMVHTFADFAERPLKNGLVLACQEADYDVEGNEIVHKISVNPYTIHESKAQWHFYWAHHKIGLEYDESHMYRFHHLTGGNGREFAKLVELY